MKDAMIFVMYSVVLFLPVILVSAALLYGAIIYRRTVLDVSDKIHEVCARGDEIEIRHLLDTFHRGKILLNMRPIIFEQMKRRRTRIALILIEKLYHALDKEDINAILVKALELRVFKIIELLVPNAPILFASTIREFINRNEPGGFSCLESLILLRDKEIKLKINKISSHQESLALWKEYQKDRSKTLKKLGLYENRICDLFILVIMVSDKYHRVPDTHIQTPQGRFFAIAERLPMEVQMILANRTDNNPRDLISSALFERQWQKFISDKHLFSFFE